MAGGAFILADYWTLKTYQLLLIFVPLAVVLGIILIIAILTALNLIRSAARDQAAREEEQLARFGPSGKPWPPAAPGVCSRCGRAFNKIYYPPDGKGLCAECYTRGDAAPDVR